jgi:hypothetical protein
VRDWPSNVTKHLLPITVARRNATKLLAGFLEPSRKSNAFIDSKRMLKPFLK